MWRTPRRCSKLLPVTTHWIRRRFPRPAPSLVAHLEDGVAGKRIGLVRELYEGADDAVVAQVNRAADALRDAGREHCGTFDSRTSLGLSAYYLVAPAEASSNLARYDGVRYGLRVDGDDVTAMYEATRTAGFGAEVKRRIMLGTYALSAGYYDAYYGQALKVRTLTIDAFRRAYAQVDMLLGATTPSVAFKLGSKSSNPMAMYLSDVFTIPTNLSGEAAISVPFGAGEPTCPSAYSSSGRDGVKPDSSRRRGFSKWRTVEHEPARTLEMVVGLEVHTELKTRSKMFCGCANSFGAEPQHQHLSDVSWPTGLAAGPQRESGRTRHGDWLGAAFDDWLLDVSSQELLLPRHAQGFSDQPVRPAH